MNRRETALILRLQIEHRLGQLSWSYHVKSVLCGYLIMRSSCCLVVRIFLSRSGLFGAASSAKTHSAPPAFTPYLLWGRSEGSCASLTVLYDSGSRKAIESTHAVGFVSGLSIVLLLDYQNNTKLRSCTQMTPPQAMLGQSSMSVPARIHLRVEHTLSYLRGYISRVQCTKIFSIPSYLNR